MYVETFKGIPASPGTSDSVLFIMPHVTFERNEVFVREALVPSEIDRLKKSIAAAIADIIQLKTEIHLRLGRTEVSIFDAHLSILHDNFFTSEMQMMIRLYNYSAETAVIKTLDQFIAIFVSMEDSYMKDRALDVKDVGYRIMDRLVQVNRYSFSGKTSGCVLMTQQLLPSQIVKLDPETVHGVIVSEGGIQSHTAMIARALQIPMIVGVQQEVLGLCQTGDHIQMDGSTGDFQILNYRR